MTRRLLAAPLTAAVAVSLAGLARAGEAAPPAGTPPPPSEATAATPQEPARPSEDTWLDVGHAFIGNTLLSPVFRVDRFFSDERDLEVERERSFLQWRNELQVEQHRSMPSYRTTVSASLRFPGVNQQLRRLQLVIEGQAREAKSFLFPGTEPQTEPELDTRTADAGLRFSLWDGLLTHADLGGGLVLNLPPGAFGRLRFRYAQPLARRVLGRFATSGFWRTNTGFGTAVQVDLERPLGARSLVRAGSSATLTEVSRGVEWSADTAVIRTFNVRAAAQVGAIMSGAERAPVRVDVYRLYTRLRRDFYRRWIFLELEPGVSWPWTPEVGRRVTWAVALRLEVQFQGNEETSRPGEKPAPAQRPSPERKEPQDPPPEAEQEPREDLRPAGGP